MSLRIASANLQWAPVEADLYFDIGPVTWRVARVLFAEPGHDGSGEYDLDLRKLPLTVEDIVWLRLRLAPVPGPDAGSSWTASWMPSTTELSIDGEVFESLSASPIEPRAGSVLVTQLRYGLDSDLLAWTLPMEPPQPVSAKEPTDPDLTVPPFRSPTSALPASGPPAPLTVRVSGTVESAPFNPTGEQWLFDLCVETLLVEENGRDYRFGLSWSEDAPKDVPHRRYLRVRYPYGLAKLFSGSTWKDTPAPVKGQRVRIDGQIRFHPDGWYELLPRAPESIRTL